jgi:hypothetical protein
MLPAFSAVDPSRFFTYRYDMLLKARQLAKANDPLVKDAVAKLKGAADGALKAARYSVMDKTKIPPSGDKHDFMSLAPYWWPDSTKPGGIPYVQRDGLTNPESRGPEFDADRIGSFGGDVEALALYYFLVGGDNYAAKAASQIRAWFLDPATRMNPNMRYGQSAPGVADGRNFGIIQTRGFMELVDAIAILGGYSGWTDTDQKGMVDWFGKYVDWLQTDSLGKSESAQPNNHGTWFDAQFVVFSQFAGRPELAKKVAEDAKTKRLRVQITKTGMQPLEMTRTKSLFYHTFNLTALYRLARVSENAGVNLWTHVTPDSGTVPDLRRAMDFVAPYADSTKKWPNEQILQFDRMDMFPVLMEATLIYQDGKYLQQVGYLPKAGVATDRDRLKYPYDKVPAPITKIRAGAKPGRAGVQRTVRAVDGRLRSGHHFKL